MIAKMVRKALAILSLPLIHLLNWAEDRGWLPSEADADEDCS
jgi:hypothetical protein